MAEFVDSSIAGAPGESKAAGNAGDLGPNDELRPIDPYDLNDEKALQLIKDRIERSLRIDGVYRNYFERDWFRNILFFAGKQWIIFDNQNRRWRQKRLPLWFPTPITNKYAEKTNDLVTVLVADRPPINHLPATDNEDDIATAEISQRMRDVMYEEADVDSFEEELASWVVLTGNCFLVPYYDYSPEYGTRTVEEQDPTTGEMVEKTYPIGALKTDVVSPFEIRIDPRIRDIRKHKWYTRIATWSVEEAREKWPEHAQMINADKEENLGQIYLDALAYLSTSFGGTSILGSGATSNDSRNPRTSIYEYHELPQENFPGGLRAIRVGKMGPVVEAGPLPDEWGAGKTKGRKFLNLVMFGFDTVPGRVWKKTRMDDLVSLQSFRNLIESNLKLTVQRMANGIWLNPMGSGVDNLSGDPGLVVDYTPISLGGGTPVKPERIPAELGNVQPLIILMNKQDDSMERVAGTFFLQGGDCVTEETECMTRQGWTKQGDLSIGDEIYSIKPETGEGHWATVNRIYRNPSYAGPINIISSQTIFGMFTPRHDWLVGNVDEKNRRFVGNSKGRPVTREKGLHKLPFELLKTHHYIPVAKPLGEGKCECSDEFISFCGWMFTDGYYFFRRDENSSKLRFIAITQSRKANPEKCKNIRNLLTNLGELWKENKKLDGMSEFHISGAFAENFVSLFPDKRPSIEYLTSLSGRQAELLVRSMMLGDGHERTHDRTRKHKTARYSSIDKELAERFQFIATLAGYATRLTSRRIKNRVAGKDIEYRVTLKSTKRISLLRVLDKVKTERYEGLIWCPNTSTGNWLARNSGRVFVTGNTPPGVTAASALSYLGERAERAISPFKKSWAKSWMRWEKMCLEIMRKHGVDERINVIAGQNKQWEVNKFKFADLKGAVNLKLDERGLFPKSRATQRATIAQLIQLGVINPQDPEQQYKILRSFGETELLGSQDLDTKEAIQEWDEFITSKGEQIPILIPLIQNSAAHITHHGNAAKTDEFRQLPPELQQLWIDHINAHYTDILARQQAFGAPPADPNAATPDGSEGSKPTSEESSAKELPVSELPSGLPATG